MTDASVPSDFSLFKVNDIHYLNIIENTGSGHQVRNPWRTENKPTLSPVSLFLKHFQPLALNLLFTSSPVQTH